MSQCPGTATPTQVTAAVGTHDATHTFALGAAITNVVSVYEWQVTGTPGTCGPLWTCAPFPFATASTMEQASAWSAADVNSTLYGVGAEIVSTPPSPSMFVQATQQTEP